MVDGHRQEGMKIAIENCPMLFSGDEWPFGNNLARTPHIWREMFNVIPDANFGLNLDPSHLVWQMIDYERAVYDFADRILHVHAKDMEIDRGGLYEHGVLSAGMNWQVPRLPGLGEVRWDRFCAALYAVGYDRWISIEHGSQLRRRRRGGQARVSDRPRRASPLRALRRRDRVRGLAPEPRVHGLRRPATSRSGDRPAGRSAPRRRSAAACRAASRRVSVRPRRSAPRARRRGRSRRRSRTRAPRRRRRRGSPAPRSGGRSAAGRARGVRPRACWISSRRGRSNGTISVGNGRSAHTPQSQRCGTGPA